MTTVTTHDPVASVRLPISIDALSPELDRKLRAVGRSRTLLKSETLYLRGTMPDAMYCIESGAVQLSTTSAKGKESVLGVVDRGRWFGEMTLLTKDPRPHDAKALTDTELWVVPAQCLHAIVDHEPAYLLEFLCLVCRRYKWALGAVENQAQRLGGL